VTLAHPVTGVPSSVRSFIPPAKELDVAPELKIRAGCADAMVLTQNKSVANFFIMSKAGGTCVPPALFEMT